MGINGKWIRGQPERLEARSEKQEARREQPFLRTNGTGYVRLTS